jgi:hypothetical protein
MDLVETTRQPVLEEAAHEFLAAEAAGSSVPTPEVSAIDRANLVLRIVGKGNKERLAPLLQSILDALRSTHRQQLRRGSRSCRTAPAPHTGRWRRQAGECTLVRFADDALMAFDNIVDASRVLSVPGRSRTV